MSDGSQQVLLQALSLSPIERAELVEQLLTSFEFPSRAYLDEMRSKEAEERVDAYERGEITTTPAATVFEKISRK